MTSRNPTLPVALRIVAAGCVVVWLAAVSACDLEHFLDFGHHGASDANEHAGSHEAEADHDEADSPHGNGNQAEAHHAEGDSHDSHDHDGKGDSCCSKLKANVQMAKPFSFNKPVFQPIPFLCVSLKAHGSVLALSNKPSHRQAKTRDWVSTPEVCLDPAHRSLAPPSPEAG